MSNYSVNLDILTMAWTDAAGGPLATGDECPLDFINGERGGASYTGVAITLQNGEWKRCGSSDDQGTTMTLDLPSAGSAQTHSFCVRYESRSRPGWYDPKLKLKNQDTGGSPSAYADAGPCDCS